MISIPILSDREFLSRYVEKLPFWKRIYLESVIRWVAFFHFGLEQRSKDRYIEHLKKVAAVVASLNIDISVQAAALFHDILEECHGFARYLAFIVVAIHGPGVLLLVVGVTNWKDNDAWYFRWLAFFTRYFARKTMLLKQADKYCVILTPYNKPWQDEKEYLLKVYDPESTDTFMDLIIKCRPFTPKRLLVQYDKLAHDIEKYAKERLDALDRIIAGKKSA